MDGLVKELLETFLKLMKENIGDLYAGIYPSAEGTADYAGSSSWALILRCSKETVRRLKDIYKTYELLPSGKQAHWRAPPIRWIGNIRQSFWDLTDLP